MVHADVDQLERVHVPYARQQVVLVCQSAMLVSVRTGQSLRTNRRRTLTGGNVQGRYFALQEYFGLSRIAARVPESNLLVDVAADDGLRVQSDQVIAARASEQRLNALVRTEMR